MFREKYKKDNEKIIASEELIGMTKMNMRAAMKGEAALKRRFGFRRAAAFVTAAAVVCLCVLGLPNLSNDNFTSFTSPQASNNSFTLTAYAAEQQPDGTVNASRQLTFNQTGILDDSSFELLGIQNEVIERENGEVEIIPQKMFSYTTFAFKIDGENIQSVTFSVDEGHFNSWDSSYNNWGNLGTAFTMNNMEFSSDTLILWGFDRDVSGQLWEDISNIPSASAVGFTTNVTVTFEDGEVQEKQIVYDVMAGMLMLNEI
jgi:hypothetical protein